VKRLARTDLAIQSRQVLHQSIWCGVVFGLVVLITVLNALPPVDVQYFVSGKIIASPMRVEALRQRLISSEIEWEGARLQDVTVLDDAAPKQAQHFDAKQQVIFLGLNSIWHSRCSHEQFQNWIDSMAKSDEPQRAVSSTKTSHELRLARWEVEAARHYQAHHEFLGDSSSVADTPPVANEKNVFQLASTGKSRVSGAPPSSTDPISAQIKQQLAETVQSLQSRLETLSQQSKTEQDQVAGQIELTDGPKIQPRCRRIPGWMALSVLILGLAAGSSAGWLQLRLQSGGVYDPKDVAAQLSREGLPEVAHVQLSSDQLESTDWLALAGQKASTAGRTGGRNLVLLSESFLALWCVVILGRICFDPLWRGLLVDSPLGALGRLLTGMP
jgi:hypothetical protein